MSRRERVRLKVLHIVQKGQLGQNQAAQLGLTERWVRKLLGRLRTILRYPLSFRERWLLAGQPYKVTMGEYILSTKPSGLTFSTY